MIALKRQHRSLCFLALCREACDVMRKPDKRYSQSNIQPRGKTMDRQVNMESEINYDSFSDYLRKRYPTRPIVFDIRPDMLDELMVELRIRKFNTIGEIDQALARTEKAVELFERDNPPNNLVDSQYAAIGIVIISLQLLYDDFHILWETVVDVVDPDKVAEYKKYIFPEGD
jgi:hypothetical protein